MKGRSVSLRIACAGAAVALGAGAFAGSASATSPTALLDKVGALTPRLEELASPALRSASNSAQARTLSLPASGPGSLLRIGDKVLVDARFRRGVSSKLGSLRAAGASIVGVSRRYDTATVAVLPASLHAVAAVPGVRSVVEDLAPIVSGSGGRAAAATCQGSVVSEGDTQLHAASARSQFNVDGSGIKVGVLSDSFDKALLAPTHASGDVSTGDLPGPGNPCGQTTPVQVLDDSAPVVANPEDEGRAMLQIVHDLAPGAALAFATASTGELNFAKNIRALRTAGANVIVDDVTYFDEPFFQDGPVSAAVNDVTGAGASYFSSAGNNNVRSGGRDVSSFEAPAFRNAGSCPGALGSMGFNQCMDFNPGSGVDNTYGISVAPGSTVDVDLQWAQPWFGVHTDLDAILLSSGGSIIGSPGADANVSTQEPFELAEWTNNTNSTQTINLAINRFIGSGGGDTASPRLKFILLGGDSGVVPTEYTASSGGDIVGPTIFGHNGAGNAVSVGAVPFNDSTKVESYSSRGPVTLYFGPVRSSSPAAPLSSPQTFAKPDVVATDCNRTTFFAQMIGGVWRFCGTSAAAPHAAAIAALQLEKHPSASPQSIAASQRSTADPVDGFGPTAAGGGLVDALGAVAGDTTPPTVTITGHPPKKTKSHRAKFTFSASEPATFACNLDGSLLNSCASPKSVHVGAGRHTFAVTAADLSGNRSQPASFSWKVRKRRR